MKSILYHSLSIMKILETNMDVVRQHKCLNDLYLFIMNETEYNNSASVQENAIFFLSSFLKKRESPRPYGAPPKFHVEYLMCVLSYAGRQIVKGFLLFEVDKKREWDPNPQDKCLMRESVDILNEILETADPLTIIDKIPELGKNVFENAIPLALPLAIFHDPSLRDLGIVDSSRLPKMLLCIHCHGLIGERFEPSEAGAALWSRIVEVVASFSQPDLTTLYGHVYEGRVRCDSYIRDMILNEIKVDDI